MVVVVVVLLLLGRRWRADRVKWVHSKAEYNGIHRSITQNTLVRKPQNVCTSVPLYILVLCPSPTHFVYSLHLYSRCIFGLMAQLI